MNQTPKVWQILSALIPIIIGIVTWVFNISTRQSDFEARLKANETAVQQMQSEYKADMKEIKQSLQSILIRLGPENLQVIKK